MFNKKIMLCLINIVYFNDNSINTDLYGFKEEVSHNYNPSTLHVDYNYG